MSEFKKALELLNSCIASIECGCNMTEDDRFWADSLKRRCQYFDSIWDEGLG